MTRIAIGALVVGMAFVTGCKSSERQDVQSEREELLQERQELSEVRTQEQQGLQEELSQAEQDFQKEQAELREDFQQEKTELQQDTQQEIAEQREDVTQEQEELAETRQEYREETAEEGVGGAGEAGKSYTGTIESKQADKLTLKTHSGSEELIVTPDTQFEHMGREITINEIPQGTNVRASYEMQADKKVADKVEVLQPAK